MTALLGARLGPYEIIAPVGAGGMGEVYRARDTRLGRDVAIKVLPPQLLDSPEALARFEREARAVAALNHPNILALHDIGREGPVSYAVTELLQGETVRARIRSGPMPPRRALEILTQVARGLGAAHERGIVHRDIKPENLFLTDEGHVKILDFGVAVRAGEAVDSGEVTKAALTEPGMLVGTPAYMAPEQLLAQHATPRSDVFAFGLVAHELLTGKHPFSRATFGETTIAVLREEPTPLGPVAASLPAGIAPLLMRCLEKQPGDRPGSARDLAIYLEALSTAPITTSGSQVVNADAESIVRRRVLLGSIVLLLLTVLLTWGYAGFMAERAVTGAIESDLARADRLVHRVQEDRLTRLALTARLLASFPGLNALFAGTDPSTINDFLRSYQASHPGTPTLIALTKHGQLLARTDQPSAADSDAAIQQLAGASGGSAVVLIDGRPHHVAVEAASAGDTPFGYIVAALPIGRDFAQSLSEATQDEIVLLSTSVVASTLRASQAPWKSLQEWRQQGGRQDRLLAVDIGGQRVVAREVPLSTEPTISAIVAKSRDEVAAPFRRIQSGLIAIGVLCAAAAIAGAFWMARSVTRAILPSVRQRR